MKLNMPDQVSADDQSDQHDWEREPQESRVMAMAGGESDESTEGEDAEAAGVAQEAAELEEELDAPHPDDPRANIRGVYVRGVETIEIPMRKKSKASAEIRIVQKLDGNWAYAHSVKWPDGGSGHLPKIDDEGDSLTRKGAALCAVAGVHCSIERHGEFKQKDDILADLTKFKAVVESWSDEEGDQVDDEATETPGAEDEVASPTEPPKPAISARPTPDEAQAAFELRVQEAKGLVADCALDMAHADAEAKEAKASYKHALERLEKIMSRGPEVYPLLDGATPKEETPEEVEEEDDDADDDGDDVQEEEAQSVEETPTATTNDDESWREVKLETLTGIPDALLGKLYEAEIETVGDLVDFQSDGKSQLTDIKGVGKAKAEVIADALEKFWADRY